MQILIPMAGLGQRFVDAGYTEPKPFIDVLGKPMIERVVDNLGGPSAGKFIFIVRGADQARRIRKMYPEARVLSTVELTAGAACTALLVDSLIDTEESLLIANSDQLVSARVSSWAGDADVDWHRDWDFPPHRGSIYTFTSEHPKWSYVAADDYGTVWGVAEKQPISNRATCGIYWFEHGADFVKYARQMIAKNIRVNNEFYIAPVFNQMILAGHRVIEVPVKEMWGLGTPEDLRAYEDAYRTAS